MRMRNLLVVTAGLLGVVWLTLGGTGLCGTDRQATIMLDYQKNSVQIRWAEPRQRITGERLSSSEIAGYNIFRSLDEKEGYRKINDQLIKDTRYTDWDIEQGNCYYYTLTTIDTRGLESPRSSVAQAVPPLAPPPGVQAFGLKRTVKLTWDKTSNNQIRGYNIYRTELAGRGYKRIHRVLDTDHEYLDHEYLDQEVVVGKNYYYALSAIDLSWQESDLSPEVAARPLVISQEELSTLERINGFRASVEGGAVVLQWEPVALKNLAGYNIYRRSKEERAGAYQRLNRDLVCVTSFSDENVEPEKSYYYLIAAEDKDKNEARFPKEIHVTVADLYINSLAEDSEGRPLKGGSLLTIIMAGTAEKTAFASLNGEDIPLKETDQKGVYYGQYRIPEDIDRTDIPVIGRLRDERGEMAEYTSKNMVTIDNFPPEAVRSLKAEVTPEAVVCLSWDLPENRDDITYVEVFRSLTDGTRKAADSTDKTADGTHKAGDGQLSGPGELISGKIDAGSFCDRSIQPRQGYLYSVVAYDQAGNSAPSYISVVTPADSIPPKIYSVKELSAPGLKHTGDIIRIQMLGEAHAEGKFSIGPKIQQISFKEVGDGRYLGEYTVQAGDDLESEPVLVELADASENRSILLADLDLSINTRENEVKPPAITAVEHNGFQLGTLVAGDDLRISVEGEPGCMAYADLGALVTRSGQEMSVELNWPVDRKAGNDVISYSVYCQQNPPDTVSPFSNSPFSNSPFSNFPSSNLSSSNFVQVQPIAELLPDITHYRIENYQGGVLSVAAKKSRGDEHIILTPRIQIPLIEIRSGFYEGTYKVQPGDCIREGEVSGCLINRQGGRSLPLAANSPVTIDTSVKITVTPRVQCLRADGKSRTDIQVEVKDAKDLGVANREITMELFTTDEYTGIAGGGHLDENKYGHLDNFYQLITDPWGRITVPYVSGVAAKTAIIRASDTVSGDVGLGYVTSYIEGFISIELTAPVRGLIGPRLEVWADNTWLTADGGHSRTIVYAKVIDAGEDTQGHEITFVVSDGEGWIEKVQPVIKDGKACAKYFSGRHIGTVKITATDKTLGISGDVFIILKSDAPARVEIRGPDGDPADKPLSMRADGISATDLTILVEDINGNPSRGVPLEVDIDEGGGKLIWPGREMVTDFYGKCRLTYQAGTRAEKVTIRARALSRVPDSPMLDKIRTQKSSF